MTDSKLETLAAPKQRVLEPPARMLRDEDAWRATIKAAPAFSIGIGREEAGDKTRGRMKTEFGPDISRPVANTSGTIPPQWTMQSRRRGSVPAGAWVPGPGKYESPSTMHRSHPVLTCSGRGWSWGSAERLSGEDPPPASAPDPGSYQPRFASSLKGSVSWSMGGRYSEPPTPHKGELWGAGLDAAERAEERKLYDSRGTSRRGGTLLSSSWTFTSRPESTLVSQGGKVPGPGTHQPDMHAMNRIRRSPSWGFGSASRFPKDPDPRPC